MIKIAATVEGIQTVSGEYDQVEGDGPNVELRGFSVMQRNRNPSQMTC